MKPGQLPWKWLLSGLVAVLLISIFLIPWLVGDTSRLGDRVAERLSEWAEGKVTFTGPVKVSFFPDISVRGPLKIEGSARLPFLQQVTVKEAKVSLDLVALLGGTVSIDMLRLQKPRITLRDGTEVGETPKSVLANLLAGAPLRVLNVRNGRIDLAGRPIRDFYLQVDAGRQTGALNGTGSFSYKGEPVRFTLTTGSPSVADKAEQVPVAFSLDSAPLKADIAATAQISDQFSLDGDMNTEIGNLRGFLTWIGFGLAEAESLKAMTAAGRFRYADGRLTFDDGTFALDGNKATGALAVTVSSHPRIEGTFAFDRLVLDPYLGRFARQGEGTEEAPAKALIFDQALLRFFDADLRISGAEIVAGPVKLGRGGFTITSKDGSVTSEIGELELCGGTAEGRVNIELAPMTKELDLVADLADIQIEPCLAPLGLAAKVSGTGALKAELSAEGNTLEAITSTLGGTLKLDAKDGSVPVDFAKLLASPMPLGERGWIGDGGSPFDELKAECRLSAGQIWCETLDMQMPRARVAGAGDIDLPRKTLNWNLSVAKPSPQATGAVAPAGAAPELSIRGPLSQPLIQRTDAPALPPEGASTGTLQPEGTPQ